MFCCSFIDPCFGLVCVCLFVSAPPPAVPAERPADYLFASDRLHLGWAEYKLLSVITVLWDQCHAVVVVPHVLMAFMSCHAYSCS